MRFHARNFTTTIIGGILLAGMSSLHAVERVPECRMNNTLAGDVSGALKAAAKAYAELGKPLFFDNVAVNPIKTVTEPRTLVAYIVSDAPKDRVTPQGCAKSPARKDDQLDDISVRGGCVVVAVDSMEIRCSADAVKIFGDLRQRPGRAHPALLYVLAHELGHLHQRRIGEYAGRVELVDLKNDTATKLSILRDSCDPASTKHEEEADAMALQVLTRLLPLPPYREPLFSEQGSVYWSVDQLNLAANAWQETVLEREFISQPTPHPSFIPTEFPTPKLNVEDNAKRFVCDVLNRKEGTVFYPGKSATHPPLERRIRKVAEALRPIAASLPTARTEEQFKSVAVLQEQVSPILNTIYRETGAYLEAVQANICSRVNGDTPAEGCR